MRFTILITLSRLLRNNRLQLAWLSSTNSRSSH